MSNEEHNPLSQLEQELWLHVYTCSLKRCMRAISEGDYQLNKQPDEHRWLEWAQKQADDSVKRFKHSNYMFCGCGKCMRALHTKLNL